MGHGYFGVVGFGCIVPIKKIISTFYDVQFEQSLLNTVDLYDVEEYFNEKGLDIFYEHQKEHPHNMFISFRDKNIELDARSSYGDYRLIDASINPSEDELTNFMEVMGDYGVKESPKLIFYSYEGG